MGDVRLNRSSVRHGPALCRRCFDRWMRRKGLTKFAEPHRYQQYLAVGDEESVVYVLAGPGWWNSPSPSSHREIDNLKALLKEWAGPQREQKPDLIFRTLRATGDSPTS